MRLILASASPRRRELLTAAGYSFDVVRPDDEAEAGLCSNCGPAELVANLALAKANDVVRQLARERGRESSGRCDAGGSGSGTGKGERGRKSADGNESAVARRAAGQEETPTSCDLNATAATPNPSPADGGGKLGYDSTNRHPPSAIASLPSFVILAADTVAECDGHVLGKPRDEDHARRMLRLLSGRKHRVYTGVCLWPIADCHLGAAERNQEMQDAKQRCGEPPTEYPAPSAHQPSTRVAVTTLQMDRLTESQLDEYLASGGWEGKAGAFGYQDRLGWVHVTDGSESNVVGLPMELLEEMLCRLGCAESP